jgi:hypothetical protein
MSKTPKGKAGEPPPGPAILESVKADYSTIKVVVLTTLACIAVLMVPFLWLVSTFVDAKSIDGKLGLSAHLTPKIMAEIVKKVDSGYSKSFIIRGDEPQPDTTLLFYSEDGQSVRLVMDASAYGSSPMKLRVLIDNNPWIEKELPFQIHLANITQHVRGDAEGGDIHVLRVVPVNLRADSTAVIQSLVLVANSR